MAKIKLEAVEAATKNLKIILTVSTHLLSNRFYSLVTFIHATLGFCLLGYSVYHFRNSPEELAQVVYYMGICVAVIVATVTGYVPTYGSHNVVKDSYHTYDYQSAIMRTKLEEVERTSFNNIKGFFKAIVFLIIWVSFNLTGMTIVEGLVKQERILLFPCWHPFDINNILFQILILLWQQYFLATMIFMAFGGGSMLFIPYIHVKAEITLLKYALENIQSRVQEMAKKRKGLQKESMKNQVISECYKQCMKMCVEHHIEILGYFYRGKRLMGIIYSTGFFSGVIACTFGGYNITSENLVLKFKNLAILFFILGYLFAMFWIADSTTTELLSVAQTVFEVKWYHLPNECQSTLQFMLFVSNQPLFYKLVLGQKVNMEAYMALIRATYYYLNFLTA